MKVSSFPGSNIVVNNSTSVLSLVAVQSETFHRLSGNYKLIEAGQLPIKIVLSTSISRWLVKELNKWIEFRVLNKNIERGVL